MQIQQEYSRLAPIYDRRWANYIERSIKATISRLAISHNSNILDFGCGTGALLQSLLSLAPDAKLTGLDFSPEMLDIAKAKLKDSAELLLGSADHLPFAEESFDLVISTSAFHYFPNPLQVMTEATRVLKTNGRLVITDWCYDYWTCRLLDFWLHLSNRAHYHTYRVKEFQDMFKAQGLAQITIERYKIDWFWGMMTAQGVKSEYPG
jgi:ubiquinone/menaquinone biosynthesis C-methylase UbiE